MADWIDQIDPEALKTATPTTGGGSGDWISNINPATLSDNEPSIAARANVQPTPPTFSGDYSLPALLHMPSGVLQGNPTVAAADRAVGPVVRSGIRVLSSIPNLAAFLPQIPSGLLKANADQVSAETGGNYGASNVVDTPKTAPPSLPVPSEVLINKLGLTAPPDQTTPEKTVESVLPWLWPSSNMLTRVGEAPGTFNKIMTAGRSEAGNLADWFVSGEAQKYAEEHGWGPVASTIAGFVGANTSTAVSRLATPLVPKIVPPKSDAGTTVDVNKELLPSAPGGVSTVPPFKDVADPNSSIASIISGGSVLPFSGTGAKSAEKAQKDAVARTADASLQALDPDTTSVLNAGPASLRAEGTRLKNQSQDVIMNEEHRLMDATDAIENQIGLRTRVDGNNLRQAAENIYTDPDVGPTVQSAAKQALDLINDMVGPDGKIAFDALKTERSTFGRIVDNLYAAGSTGKRTGKSMIAAKISPIEDAMSDTMADAARQNGGPQLEQQWRDVDAGWRQHNQTKRDLEDTGGKLAPGRTNFAPSPGGKQVGKVISDAVEGVGDQGTAPIQNIEEGLGEQPARSAVAEAIAARGRPKNTKGTQDFQPSTFGEGVQSRVDPEILAYIEQRAGLGARQNLENAAEAGSRSSEPMQQGGLRKAIGNTVGAVPYLGTVAATLHPALGVLSPLTTLLVSASHDPDFIRAVARRSRSVSELAPQLATHGGLSTIPSAIDPAEAVRQGVGAGARAITTGASTATHSIPAILKYLSQLSGS